MDNVIIVEHGAPMTTSVKIAEMFGKRHSDVIRDVREGTHKIEEADPDANLRSAKFEETSYIDSNGQERTMFKLNKNAMIFVVMGYKTKKATRIKLEYIASFDDMQKQLEQQAQQNFFPIEDVDQQTKRITAEAYKMQCENGRMKEFRLAMKQADKLERNDLAELLLEKQVETFIGQPIKQALPIEHTPDLSDFYLTATNIATRFGLTPTQVGTIANKVGLRSGIDRILDADERWFYTDEAVEKMRARMEA